MELYLELVFTIFLFLIFTFLFNKLIIAMHPVSTDKMSFTQEAVKIDKFQWTPLPEDLIKLGTVGKSCDVKVYKGVEVEDQFQDVVAIHEDGNKKGELISGDGDQDISFELEEDLGFDEGIKNEVERKVLCEIEIESVEDEEESDHAEGEMMGDWEEIGKEDFEELLGKRAGLLVDVASD